MFYLFYFIYLLFNNLYTVGTQIIPMNRPCQHFPPVGQFPYSIFPYVPVKSNGHSVYGNVGCDNLCYRNEIWADCHRPEGAEVADCSRRDRRAATYLQRMGLLRWPSYSNYNTQILNFYERCTVQVTLGLRRDYVPVGTVGATKISIKLIKLYESVGRQCFTFQAQRGRT